jgi:hypothetical protein
MLPPQQLQPYVSGIDRHFGPFRGHPAVARIRELRDSHGFELGAAMRLALSLGEPPGLRERAPLDGPADPLDRRWRTPATRPFLEELRRFAADTRADAFFAAHQALYDSASTRLRRLAGTGLDLGWFEPFFGVSPPGELRIAPMLAMSRAAFGARVQPAGAPPERWIVVQHMRDDSAGVPTYPEEYGPTLAHEVIHPFVDLVGAYADHPGPAEHGERITGGDPDLHPTPDELLPTDARPANPLHGRNAASSVGSASEFQGQTSREVSPLTIIAPVPGDDALWFSTPGAILPYCPD